MKVIKKDLNGTTIGGDNRVTLLVLPSWLVFETETRRFYGTPDEMDVSYDITLKISDKYAEIFDTISFNLNNSSPKLN